MLRRRGPENRAAARLDLADLVRALSPPPSSTRLGTLPARLARLPRGWQFALLGSLLFLLRPLLPGGGAERETVALSAAQVAAAAAGFERALGRPPGPAELAAAVEREVAEQLLEAEARRLRLDFGDRSIEQRLVLKMRALAPDLAADESELRRQALELGLDRDLVIGRLLREKMRLLLLQDTGAAPFGPAELEDALHRHRERFEQEPLYSFTQILFAAEAGAAAERAAALRRRLAAESLPAEQAAGLGDPFPLPARQAGRTRGQIARSFGGDFAAGLAALEPGAWSAPLRSPFGWHLVYLHSRQPGGLPAAETVRPQLLALLEEERSARRLEQGLARLRRLYRVEIDWPPELREAARFLGQEPP